MSGSWRAACAGWIALIGLAGCTAAPTLTLSGRWSLRAKPRGGALTQIWTAGAALAWSHAALRPDEGSPLLIREDPWTGVQPGVNGSAPCAVPSACAWELEQRTAALARLAPLESEAP